jgi:hypothetical protein
VARARKCRIVLFESGFDSPIEAEKQSLTAALAEARALSRTSDGAVNVTLACQQSVRKQRPKKGYVRAQGPTKWDSREAVFTCKKGRCRFHRGNWSDRLDD